MTAGIIKQTLFIYALAIVISMLVAYMIVGINKILFFFEDAAKRRAEQESKNDGKAA